MQHAVPTLFLGNTGNTAISIISAISTIASKSVTHVTCDASFHQHYLILARS